MLAERDEIETKSAEREKKSCRKMILNGVQLVDTFKKCEGAIAVIYIYRNLMFTSDNERIFKQLSDSLRLFWGNRDNFKELNWVELLARPELELRWIYLETGLGSSALSGELSSIFVKKISGNSENSFKSLSSPLKSPLSNSAWRKYFFGKQQQNICSFPRKSFV